MTRYRVILLLFVLSLAGSLITRREVYWSLTGALFALLVFSVIWALLSVRRLDVRRKALARAGQVGQYLEEEIAVSNLSWLPKLWLEVKDQSTLPHHHASRVVSLMKNAQWRGWRVRTLCTQRGRFQLGPLLVSSGDPLGVFQRSRPMGEASHVVIFPAVYPLPNFPLRTSHVPGGETTRKRTQNITTNASGVRDYVTGDSQNRIHWRISARRQKLTVKEFDLDPTSDYWVLLDLAHAAHSALPYSTEPISENPSYLLPPSTEEYAVSAAASVAKHFLAQGRSMGMVTHTAHREALQPDRGDRQLNKLLETLAMVRAVGRVSFDRLVRAEARTLARGATVVLISASANPEWADAAAQVARTGARTIAIVIDRATFGDAENPMDDVIKTLAEAGVPTRIVRQGDSLSDVLA